MEIRHLLTSASAHFVLFALAADTSVQVHEQARLERRLAAAHEYAETSGRERMRTMVDEMEMIRDIMERAVAPADVHEPLAPRGDEEEEAIEPRATDADLSTDEAPEGAEEPLEPAEERADESEADDPEATPQPAREQDEDEPERLAAEAAELAREIDRTWRAALAERDLEPQGETAAAGFQGTGAGDASGRIAAMNAAARERLRDVLALREGQRDGSDVAWDDTGAYWSQFGLDALGGRSAAEFENRPDESELARNRNARSARLDNTQLRNEIESSFLEPARAFLGPGDRARWVYVDSWYTIGPFPNPERREHDTSFPPETHVDLDAIYLNSDGAPVEWTYVRSTSPRVAPPTMDEYTVHYAYTEVRSDRPRRVWLALGSDDSVLAWLNGERVWESDVHLKEWHLADGFREIELRPGYNSLLIRLENAWGPGFFSASIRLGD